MSTTTAGPGSTGPPRQVQCSGVRPAHSSSDALCAARYRALIPSTTVGSASVVVSPSASSSLTLRSRRRMILPERVLGRSSVNRIVFGFAIGPIVLPTWSRSSAASSSLGSLPDAQDHERGDRLPDRRVGPADDGGLGHGRMADERVLDLGRRDVVTRHEHHVVDPAEQPEVARRRRAWRRRRRSSGRRTGPSRCRGTAAGRPRSPRSIDGHGRVSTR